MDRNTPRLLQAAILGCFIFLAAYTLSNVGNKYVNQRRYVAVKGLCEREYPADRVVWPILFKEMGNDLVAVSQSADKKMSIIKQFLLDNGIAESEISISVPDVFDREADRYSSTQDSNNRYFMTNVITVNSNNVDVVRQLMARQGELIKQGITLTADDYRYAVKFQYTKLNEVKVGMVQEATANARATAEQFAQDSDSQLGKIKQASQGEVSIYDRDANTPHIKRIRIVTSISYFLED